MQTFQVATENDMLALGQSQSSRLRAGDIVFLSGELGAGKSVFARGILRGFGCNDAMPSPTYTLLAEYTLRGARVLHFDLYRMQSALELEGIGIRDLLAPDVIAMFEWPERGAGVLPPPHWRARFEYANDGRRVVWEGGEANAR